MLDWTYLGAARAPAHRRLFALYHRGYPILLGRGAPGRGAILDALRGSYRLTPRA